eukprot:TRINITY_DN1204_c0_g1_i3.p2 TRINITY_DN1204_c0_g1~~TRINITY_DN1204_c0_g1_i3.p2  ORF type:complete len:105 (-),score=13.27 TRINITY_DN1204_c0_g1_i3:253-567(-)
MSWNNLCECVYQHIRRQLAVVNGIVQNVNNQEYVAHDGNAQAFNLQRPAGNALSGISDNVLLTIVFVVLMTFVMLAMRRPSPAAPAPVQKPRNSGPSHEPPALD